MRPTDRKALYSSGVPARLLAFFKANPTEELSLQDVTAKFDCTYETAKKAIARVSTEIESVHVVRLKSKGRFSTASTIAA